VLTTDDNRCILST